MRLKYSVVIKSIFLIWILLMLMLFLHYHTNVQNSFESRVNTLDQAILKVGNKIENYSGRYQKVLYKFKKLEDLSQTQEEVIIASSPSQNDKKEEVRVKDPVIPVLVIACNRQQAIKRSLQLLLKYRPSESHFPIIVSQDCGHIPTTHTIRAFGDQVQLIQQPDLSDIPLPLKERKFVGYYKISRHYKWALDTVFKRGYDAVLIVEDDLDIAPDFFNYFAAMYPLLMNDPTVYCVSAWNDNGINSLVDVEGGASVVYRSDFFSGLGWMLNKNLWAELFPKWPRSYWDDWIRNHDQRKGRSCIRPEISRTYTFGRKGVSNGQFYDKYLAKIVLNNNPVDFTLMDTSFLHKDTYDEKFLREVRESTEVSASQLKSGRVSGNGSCRIVYRTKIDFKNVAKIFGLMNDFKDGVPRTSYLGVVTFFYAGRRVFLAPQEGWSGYDPSWA